MSEVRPNIDKRNVFVVLSWKVGSTSAHVSIHDLSTRANQTKTFGLYTGIVALLPFLNAILFVVNLGNNSFGASPK